MIVAFFLTDIVKIEWYCKATGTRFRQLSLADGEEIGTCPYCGYNLTGNVSGVCPECGTAVQEHDAGGNESVPTKEED